MNAAMTTYLIVPSISYALTSNKGKRPMIDNHASMRKLFRHGFMRGSILTAMALVFAGLVLSEPAKACTFWFDVRNGNGDFLHYRTGNVGANKNSVVLGSITELRTSVPGGAFDTPFIGGATLELHNIAPQSDGSGTVEYIAQVAWSSPLWFRVSLMVC